MKISIKKIFVLYLFLLILFVIFKFNGNFNTIVILHQSIKVNRAEGIWNINFSFLKSIMPYVKNIPSWFALKNIGGNLVPFIPLGFFLSYIYFKRNFIKTFVFCLIIILLIEIIEFIFMIGFFDVDDILLNMVGCVFGYAISLLYNIIKVDFR